MNPLPDLSSRRSAYWSYLLGFVALLLIVSQFQLFWRSNDDVTMSLIVDGGGQVLKPGPHLALTNVAWGYLVYGLHLLGDPWAYASSIYFGLALSYLTLVYAFVNIKLNHPLAALVLLCVYLPTVINPQHTLVAGYLGFAGIVLLCNAIERRSFAAGYVAALLLVLSSLIRWDETAFVALVGLPLCWRYVAMAWSSAERQRWLWLAATTCIAGVGFLVLDWLTFGTGDWREFAETYGYVMLFTDYGIGKYIIRSHREALQGTGFSVNDLHLFTDWFYCDTQVFVPERLAALLQHLSWTDRIATNLRNYWALVKPLRDLELTTLAATAVVFLAAHRRRWHLLACLGVLALLVLLLMALGRPEITRVYVPALGAVLIIGALELDARRLIRSCLAAVAILIANGHYLLTLHTNNVVMQSSSVRIRAATCALPKDSLLITWGAEYPYNLNYLPFGSRDTTCYLNNYSFGEYSLAPFALEHLHSYTGGKDFVPALLSGQSFDIMARRFELNLLHGYFLNHYHADLQFEPDPISRHFRFFRIHVASRPPGS